MNHIRFNLSRKINKIKQVECDQSNAGVALHRICTFYIKFTNQHGSYLSRCHRLPMKQLVTTLQLLQNLMLPVFLGL